MLAQIAGGGRKTDLGGIRPREIHSPWVCDMTVL